MGSFLAVLEAFSNPFHEEMSFLHPLSGDSILHVLCREVQVDAVAAILKNGVDINQLNKLYDLAIAGDKMSFTAKLSALSAESHEELSFLHPLSGKSILHVLCGKGYIDAVNAVLKKGADVNQLNKLQVPVQEDIWKLLEKTKKSLMAARDGFDAETSYQMLQQLSSLEECLSGGAIPNATLDDGRNNALSLVLGLHWTTERRSQVILYRADLIVVGNGASGKTTLLHRLKWDQFLERVNMTDGIKMTNISI
eukprot:gene69327-biopygen21047